MPTIDEIVSERFLKWERRGRGWQVFPYPVSPEPPFIPFPGNYIPPAAVDDGRRPTIISSFIQRLSDSLAGQQEAPPIIEHKESDPDPLDRDELVEFQLVIPQKFGAKMQAITPILSRLGLCREPIAFELVSTGEHITVQFAACPNDVHMLRRHLKAQFPEVIVAGQNDFLASQFGPIDEAELLIVEFGLAREFAYPLSKPDSDPFVGLAAALGDLYAGELALFQVIFQPVTAPWAESLLEAVTDSAGKPFFRNVPELTELAQEKTSSPLFAAIVRIAVQAADFDRVLDIARDIAGSLRAYSRLEGNELIPLDNSEYPFEAHLQDVLYRQCRRTGMLLNTEELISLVHLPTAEVHSPKLKRDHAKTKAVPKQYTEVERGLLLGHNSHAGEISEVWLSPEDRTRHVHILGASGTGKSTLLFNLIRQDIEAGRGVALLDPHGDLVERILGIIPPGRVADVVLIDPSDNEYSVGFNILSAHSDLEKNLLASDLVSVFQRLSTSWGDQMGSVFQNAILAFLESSRGGTLADLRRFLLESEYRKEFLYTVKDADIVYYWLKGFSQLSGNKSIGPVITRLDTFLAPKPIRHMVSQQVNRLDFGEILDTGKIFLAKLPQGLMGRENSFLLGSLLVAKFQQTAMARQAQEATGRRDYSLYVDECASFITPSMAEILAGARKYRLGLILSHQEMRQLERDREVAGAVLSNCHTRIVFRVGDADACSLENGFASFDARDLQNLEIGHAICRIEKANNDFNLSVALPDCPADRDARATREAVIAASRKRYGTPRAEVEAAAREKLAGLAAESTAPKRTDPATTATEIPPTQSPAAVPPQRIHVAEASVPATSLPEPKDLGRGGEQHKTIQHRIKSVAEELGFHGTVEKEVLNGRGSIDLALEKGPVTIACEITVTTTIDHEFKNVKKCLEAGFSRVAVISTRTERLKQIAEAVQGGLGPEKAAQVGYFTPDEFIASLRELTIPSEMPAEVMRRGYKVKRTVANLTPEETLAREAVAHQAISEALRRKSK